MPITDRLRTVRDGLAARRRDRIATRGERAQRRAEAEEHRRRLRRLEGHRPKAGGGDFDGGATGF